MSMLGESFDSALFSAPDMGASTVSLDGATKWGKPSVQGQSQMESTWDISSVGVHVFDLSKDQDLKSYKSLLKKSMATDPTVVIMEQEKVFSEDIHNWKIFITSVNLKYKKLTGTDKK